MKLRIGWVGAALAVAASVMLAAACDQYDTIGGPPSTPSPSPDAGALPAAAGSVLPVATPAAPPPATPTPLPAAAPTSSDGMASPAPVECPFDREVLTQVAPATYAIVFVALTADGERRPLTLATAFAVGPNQLATNAHVTRELEALVAQLPYEEVVAVQTGTGAVVRLELAVSHPDYVDDPLSQPDVGLLTTREPLPTLLTLAPADGVTSVGLDERILVAGFAVEEGAVNPIVPNQTTPTPTALAGSVTALRNFDPAEPVARTSTDLILHDADTWSGMSGAPLSRCGVVVGVNDADLDDSGEPLADVGNDYGVDVRHLHALLAAFDGGTLAAFDLNAHPSPAAPASADAGVGSLCSDTCIYAGDFECDDGGPNALPNVFCPLGTDCSDCGPRTPSSAQPPESAPDAGVSLAGGWIVFTDPLTGQACDTINGADFEAIVLSPSRQLLIVSSVDLAGLASGVDSLATGLTLDDAGNLVGDGVPAGTSVAFAIDGDGAPRLWALLADGSVLALATELSGLTPAEFQNVRCDACGAIDAAPPDLCP